MSDSTCSKFDPRGLLLFPSYYKVTDKQVIDASKVATENSHCSAAHSFFNLVLDENVCVWFNTNIFGRVLKTG